jgi:hypothetical protein
MESTLKVLDFEQLLSKLNPILSRRDPSLVDLSVTQDGDSVTFTINGSGYTTTARVAQLLLFGPWPSALGGNHPVLVKLKGIVPIPWVYPSNLNYQ